MNAYLTTLKLHPPTTIAEAKFRRDWITNPSELTSSSLYFGVNWPLMRFSDVLLLFAEADNELNNGPTAAGIAAFEEVRTKRGTAAMPLADRNHTYRLRRFLQTRSSRKASLEFGGEGSPQV